MTLSAIRSAPQCMAIGKTRDRTFPIRPLRRLQRHSIRFARCCLHCISLNEQFQDALNCLHHNQLRGTESAVKHGWYSAAPFAWRDVLHAFHSLYSRRSSRRGLMSAGMSFSPTGIHSALNMPRYPNSGPRGIDTSFDPQPQPVETPCSGPGHDRTEHTRIGHSSGGTETYPIVIRGDETNAIVVWNVAPVSRAFPNERPEIICPELQSRRAFSICQVSLADCFPCTKNYQSESNSSFVDEPLRLFRVGTWQISDVCTVIPDCLMVPFNPIV